MNMSNNSNSSIRSHRCIIPNVELQIIPILICLYVCLSSICICFLFFFCFLYIFRINKYLIMATKEPFHTNNIQLVDLESEQLYLEVNFDDVYLFIRFVHIR